MKLHAPLGADMLSAVDFPYPVVPIVRHHHENWDGTGYPDGLQRRGDSHRRAHAVGRRLLRRAAVAPALPPRAVARPRRWPSSRNGAGTMYDPTVVDAFEAIQADIEAQSVDEPLPEVLDRFAQAPADWRRPEPTASAGAARDARLRDRHARSGSTTSSRRSAPTPASTQVCEMVSRYLLRLAPAGLVVFYRRVEATDEVAAVFASGFGEALVQDVRMPLGHGVSGWVAANGRSVINADSALDLGDRLDGLEPKFRSVLSIPLIHRHAARSASSRSTRASANAFREEQRQAIELISSPVAEAFSRADARRSLLRGR